MHIIIHITIATIISYGWEAAELFEDVPLQMSTLSLLSRHEVYTDGVQVRRKKPVGQGIADDE